MTSHIPPTGKDSVQEAEAFEQLCREHGIAGTAAARQCEVFWRAGARFTTPTSPTPAEAVMEAREQRDAAMRALEAIAVGDSADPVRDAGDELVVLGWWRKDALDGLRTTPAEAPAGQGEAIKVGRLPTRTQDDYPGLGAWWVQLRIGADADEVLARVYGDSPEQAVQRAHALAATPLHAQVQPAEQVGEEPVTPEMIQAGAKAAREYYERTGGNDPAVIYRAMRAATPAQQQPVSAEARDAARWGMFADA